MRVAHPRQHIPAQHIPTQPSSSSSSSCSAGFPPAGPMATSSSRGPGPLLFPALEQSYDPKGDLALLATDRV